MTEPAGTGAAAPAVAADRDGNRVDWEQVRLILGARWRVVLRGAASSWWRMLLTAFGWLMFAVVVVGVSVAAGFFAWWIRTNGEFGNAGAAVMHAAFLLCFVSLAVTPALGLRGNEFLDVTKLFTLPVGHRTVFVASLGGMMLSPGVLFLVAPAAGMVVGWGGGPVAVLGGLVALAGVALSGIALGQIGLLLFLDVFRSRKWRDASRIVMVLFSAGIYSGMRFVTGDIAASGLRTGLRALDAWKDWLMPLPSWWAAHAVTGTSALRWVPALALPLLVVWLVSMAARLQERAYFGEIEERSEVSAGPSRGVAVWLGRRFRGALGGLVEKDARLLLREPAVRIMLIQQFAYSVLPFAAAVWRPGARHAASEGAPPGAAELSFAGIVFLPVLLAAAGLAMNPLGTEGPGLQHVLLSPVPRRTVLLSKVIALTAVVGGALALLCAGGTLAVAMLAWHLPLPEALGRAGLALVEAPAAYLVSTGVGAVFGAYFPVRIGSRDRRALRQATGASGGCLRALAGLVAVLASVVLCAPVAAGFHHPAIGRWLHAETGAWLAITVPAALAYAACVAWGGAVFGGAVLADREEAALEVLTKSYE